jgi:hypothetical protein
MKWVYERAVERARQYGIPVGPGGWGQGWAGEGGWGRGWAGEGPWGVGGRGGRGRGGLVLVWEWGACSSMGSMG